ncbi:MAG: hypothetical protein IKZ83_02975, partial [Prevotella sp.]|nr:hypothetical protein [Prevotella sp.]
MKKYTKFLVSLIAGTMFLTSCLSSDDNWEYREVIVSDGLFVINEGNYSSKIDGSMDFISYATNTLSVNRNVFEQVNGRSLGGTPNHAIRCGSKMYIATTDENRVEVLDAMTLKALTPVTITAPRELCTDGEFVYVSSYTGEVSKVDTASLTIAAKSQVVGTNLEGIAHRDGSIYVCNAWNIDYTFNTNLVKLSAATLAKEKDITVVANPNQLIADGDKLFLASWGNYGDIPATIQRIDQNDQVTKLANATHMALGKNGLLYLISSTYDENWNLTNSYAVLNLATGEEFPFIDGKEIDDPCTIGVDPISGYVFIASRKKYPNADGVPTVSYTQDGYVACYTANGNYVTRIDCGVN